MGSTFATFLPQAFIVLGFFSCCKNGTVVLNEPVKEAVLTNAEGKKLSVEVEVVRTPQAIQQGLMWRKNLPADAGMFFIMPNEKIQTFWMRNTLIPLDMIFIKSDMTVAGVVHNAEPKTEVTRYVPVPSRYVLEVNGGWAKKNGIARGTRVSISGFEL